jgi:CheY-like chemotaxis protein/nitrogen-specific signal transduction histidine kinase
MEEKIAQRTAEVVVAREAAEAANRAKSAFLSNMSHELRTPMNGVMGMIELALRRATDEKQADWLGKARTSAAHLLSVINDILDIAKIEAGRVHVEHGEFRLITVLDLLSNLLAPEVSRRGLDFVVAVAPELADRALRGDAQRLGQILLNLAGNALKFTDAGSVQVNVSIEDDGPDTVRVRFQVKDSGIGIAPVDHARLFREFEQVGDSRSGHRGGTGLGLAICKRLVQLMGGEIGLESAPGAGSTFWFTLPLGWKRDAAQPGGAQDAALTSAALTAEFEGVPILLAEDNPINQEVVRVLIENAGLRVDLASDGAAAVDMAISGHYRLILMDVQMPKLSGIDAVRAIRQAAGVKRIPIIALTASVFEQDRLRCLEAGMDDHYAKPVDPDKLYKVLLKWLRQPSPAARQPGHS